MRTYVRVVSTSLERKEGGLAGSSAIEWTEATWNPVRLLRRSARLRPLLRRDVRRALPGRPGSPLRAGLRPPAVAGEARVPVPWKKPKMIFVNSMSDLFHEDVPDDYVADFRGDGRGGSSRLPGPHEASASDSPSSPRTCLGLITSGWESRSRTVGLSTAPTTCAKSCGRSFRLAEPLLGFLEGLDLTASTG